MDILKLFGLKKKTTSTESHSSKDILNLWEDDSLMIELLPIENLDFIKNETRRILDYGQEHFDGSGFTDITPIKEKPVKTIEKLIDISEIKELLSDTGLGIVDKFHMQGVGLLSGDKAPLGFGSDKFAIICNKQGKLIKDIWFAGHTNTEEDRERLINAFTLIGKAYNLIGVNWFKCEYYNLVERSSAEEFVKNSC